MKTLICFGIGLVVTLCVGGALRLLLWLLNRDPTDFSSACVLLLALVGGVSAMASSYDEIWL